MAQIDSASLHATLAGWADDMWLLILDRGAADGGLLDPAGILRRFHPEIDEEYQLDLVSSRPSLSEEFTWNQSEQGARFWGGSINHVELVDGADFKAKVPLGRSWTAGARFNHTRLKGNNRDIVRIAFEKRWSRPFAFAEGNLLTEKSQIDLTIGGGWRDAHGEARVSFTTLDIFTDAIYQGLKVDKAFADTAIDHERRPYGLRATIQRRVGPRLRIELEGGGQLSTRFRAYLQVAPDSGFRQEERAIFGGILAEYALSPRARAGATATYARAETSRTPLPQGTATDDYALSERTARYAVFALINPLPRLRSELWLAREFRPERRDYRGNGAPDVDYEDRSWIGSWLMEYRAHSGFRAHGAFEMDLREPVRGEGQVPGVEVNNAVRNTRLRFDLGWDVASRFHVLVGYRVDLDGDPQVGGRPWYDGAHGGFVMYW